MGSSIEDRGLGIGKRNEDIQLFILSINVSCQKRIVNEAPRLTKNRKRGSSSVLYEFYGSFQAGNCFEEVSSFKMYRQSIKFLQHYPVFVLFICRL